MEFSVVIAAYNASSTLERTLNSIYNQSYQDFEVIVVDDASQDFEKTVLIVDKFLALGMKIRLISHEVNRNGAAARNTGIDHAQGHHIVFIDADDEWLETKLEVYKEKIDLLESPSLIFSQVSVSSNGNISSSRPNKGPNKEQHISEYLFLSGGFIQTSTICVPTDFAKSLRFDDRFRRHQDYDFCLRAYHKEIPFIFIKKSLTIYHVEGKVFKSKLEDVNYCYWWLNEMRLYMSELGYGGYKFFLISGRLYCARSWLPLIKNILSSLKLIGIKGVWISRDKVKFILRNIF
ncbi:glycosyltransferase family 2 protein [Vibrio sp. EA2]|uniref:glycosyltransferase family 2 protein n=1 Tax=Vibrio sp. EA2 TaxID=3079860 RepID=UPI002948FCEF|nr:glycosyltransferase family 2 protein [Vibrio sp. EA2]MDV6253343.1 glycosyltransferase family 2 protein [Vibrio sp. EA2]